MTTMVKGAESQMNSISAMLIYPDSIVPFQTQCEPFRCRRPRGFEARAPGAQRVPAPPAIWPRVPGRAQRPARWPCLRLRTAAPGGGRSGVPAVSPHSPGGVDSVTPRLTETWTGKEPKKSTTD